MTISDLERARALERLTSLLPQHVRARDDDTDGLLRALLDAVAGELGLLEADLDSLYSSWFVETCPEWVVPYLADLVGLTGLPGDLGAGPGAAVSRRAVVANTVAYRRRKGTVAVVEQVVRDVTGWPTRAVEAFRLLAATGHVNHPRADRPAFGSVRVAARTELESPRLAAGALTGFAHLPEARRVESGRGRYSIGSIDLFVFPLQVYDAPAAPARRLADWWSTHPLGWDQPLFAVPATETAIEHLAAEADLPVPLRPRRLLAALTAAREGRPGEQVPVAVRVDDDPDLEPERVRVCGLESLATAPAGGVLPGWQVMVDCLRGRILPYLDGSPTDPTSLHVDHAYGAVADVGAGTYDRSLAHHDALLGDPFVGDVDLGGEHVGAQVHVQSVDPAPGSEASLVDGVAAIAAGWADPLRGLVGGTQVLSVGDSERYAGDLIVEIPAESRLVVVAAAWPGRPAPSGDVEAPVPGVYAPEGLRPRLAGDLRVTGGSGASLVLDGLVIEGDVVVEAGALRSLTLSQCTLAGRLRVLGTDAAGNRELSLSCSRSLLGGLRTAVTVPEVALTDSVVDPALRGGAGAAVAAPGATLTVVGSTVLGDIGCRVLEVTSSICDGTTIAQDRQSGCARFSFFGPGSQVPRRFRCVPASEAGSRDAPSYVEVTPGSPSYPSLAAGAPASIRLGGEYDAEMGVHHHLRRPPRLAAARRLVAPYLPAGMTIGMFGS